MSRKKAIFSEMKLAHTFLHCAYRVPGSRDGLASRSRIDHPVADQQTRGRTLGPRKSIPRSPAIFGATNPPVLTRNFRSDYFISRSNFSADKKLSWFCESTHQSDEGLVCDPCARQRQSSCPLVVLIRRPRHLATSCHSAETKANGCVSLDEPVKATRSTPPPPNRSTFPIIEESDDSAFHRGTCQSVSQ